MDMLKAFPYFRRKEQDDALARRANTARLARELRDAASQLITAMEAEPFDEQAQISARDAWRGIIHSSEVFVAADTVGMILALRMQEDDGE